MDMGWKEERGSPERRTVVFSRGHGREMRPQKIPTGIISRSEHFIKNSGCKHNNCLQPDVLIHYNNIIG